jgi:hypothetical protein
VKGPAGFALALAAALIAAGLIHLAKTGPALAGSNGVPAQVYVTSLRPGESLCLDGQRVPARADRVQIWLGASATARGRFVIDGRAGGREVTRGSASPVSGQLTVPIRPVASSDRIVRLCLRNRLTVPVDISGRLGAGAAETSRHKAVPGLPSLVYTASARRSWLDVGGAIIGRFDHVRWSPFGGATAWVAIALALAAIVAGVTLTLRGVDGD